MDNQESRPTGMRLDERAGYFKNGGVNVMAFDDIYPAGHQSGVSILMHGKRIATCGDLRFEQTPGQWQPVPKQLERVLDVKENAIVTSLRYPDEAGNLKGFNPMIYPDAEIAYRVIVKGEGESVRVTLDLEKPIPPEFEGKLCFNLELFPGELFGKPWIMDGAQGIFPRQPNGPVKVQSSNFNRSGHQALNAARGPFASREHLAGYEREYSPIVADDLIAEPYATGKKLTICPDDPMLRASIECMGQDAELKLYDGRMNHNNGWFVVSCTVPAGCTEGAVCWKITPNAVDGWRSPTVVQVSQVGYHPDQTKMAVLETDPQSSLPEDAKLYRISEAGEVLARGLKVGPWGDFLRYRYYRADFTDVREEGLYRVRCGDAASDIFRIARDVYDRGVWQPVLEYFLPVQMCHMRVQEKYRVWHGLCHNDDARMAPLNHIHFDGYAQGSSTLTAFQPGDAVPGLNVGGWHDAGDYDLRVESQSGEVYILSLAYEEFGVYYDATTIDQRRKLVEIHQPDGKNDILQQIEHGVLSLVGGWGALGRLYRGIICNNLRQYVLLGDASAMTDGAAGDEDDRWVFTEENPARELTAAAHLAAAARALRGFNDALSAQALEAAETLFARTLPGATDDDFREAKLHAAAELLLTTGSAQYQNYLISQGATIAENIERLGWIAARVLTAVNDPGFESAVRRALPALAETLAAQCAQTPYDIPYKPHIWGAGWGIQSMAFRYYFLHRAFPETFGRELLERALSFVLGCHPGGNTASFASGVGAKSATVAYGANRGDWSYIPGGVVSGTALIRPDFPELLTFPYLWQQSEYVIGGGSSHYMFLVLAVRSLLNG